MSLTAWRFSRFIMGQSVVVLMTPTPIIRTSTTKSQSGRRSNNGPKT
jgi:hypothetical protein